MREINDFVQIYSLFILISQIFLNEEWYVYSWEMLHAIASKPPFSFFLLHQYEMLKEKELNILAAASRYDGLWCL